MKAIMNKIASYRYAKQVMLGLLLITIYSGYQIYLWAKTESTDDSYIQADISNVSAEINGVLSEILIKNNNLVEEGQIIAKIDDESYKEEFNKAEHSLASAQYEIEQIIQKIKLENLEYDKAEENYLFASENYKISKIQYERIEQLNEDSYASQKSFDDAEVQLKQHKNELAQAELNQNIVLENIALLEIEGLMALEKYNTAKAEYELAKQNLDRTTIRSPITGIMGNSSMQKGNYVRAGVVLFAVVPVNDLYIEANFKETQVQNLA
ncbi:MAG: HlyD family secretion protein [Rickettsiaceae bacterium]